MSSQVLRNTLLNELKSSTNLTGKMKFLIMKLINQGCHFRVCSKFADDFLTFHYVPLSIYIIFPSNKNKGALQIDIKNWTFF